MRLIHKEEGISAVDGLFPLPPFIFLALFAVLFLSPPCLAAPIPNQTLGAVATQHALATQTAVKILQKGGNAFDAAIGAALTLGVVEPYNSGLGGGGFVLLWDAKKRKAHAIDFRETAPRAANARTFMGNELPPDATQIGPWAIATPGVPAGLGLIRRRWGKLSWANLFADAISYAEQGFDGGVLLHRKVQERADCLSRDYQSSQIYKELLLEEPASTFLLQPEVAISLKRLRDFGPQDFYVGVLARRIADGVKSKGGLISEDDLAQYRVIERTALFVDFPWGRVWGIPLPSSGGLGVLQGLGMLEALHKKNPEALVQQWPLSLVEVLEKIFLERNQAMGDPDFIRKPALRVSSQPRTVNQTRGGSIKRQGSASAGNTTHLSIVDGEGNAIAMTLSLNLPFGSCLTAGGSGVMMNSEMDDFTTQLGQPNAFGLVQGIPNQIEPGKRPLSSMAPTLVTQNGKVIAVLGSPGGPKIITSVLQVLAQRFLVGRSWEEALRAPRIHFQGKPAEVLVELGSPEEWIMLLQISGFAISSGSPWGNVQIVAWDVASKSWIALNDPRGQGSAQIVSTKSATGNSPSPLFSKEGPPQADSPLRKGRTGGVQCSNIIDE